MKKPLHLVMLGEFRASLFREYFHRGQKTWKGIGSISAGNHGVMQEYIASVEFNSGRRVAIHSVIPIDVYTV